MCFTFRSTPSTQDSFHAHGTPLGDKEVTARSLRGGFGGGSPVVCPDRETERRAAFVRLSRVSERQNEEGEVFWKLFFSSD